MATLTQAFRGRAGKTVKPRPPPVQSSDSSEEGSSQDSNRGSDSDASEPEARALGSMSTFVASPPTQADAEVLTPSEVTINKVNLYMGTDLLMIHVKKLRWDTTLSWGQLRVVQDKLVQNYKSCLEKEPPRQPVRVLLKDMGTGLLNKLTPIRCNMFLYPQGESMWFWAVNTSAVQFG